MRRQPYTEAVAATGPAEAATAAGLRSSRRSRRTLWRRGPRSRPSRTVGGRGSPLLTGSRSEAWTGRKQTTGRLVVGLLLAALVPIIILAAVGVL